MPTLRRWIENDRTRLIAEQKSVLIEHCDVLTEATFAGHYDRALDTVPFLYQIANNFEEPGWRVLAHYYDSLFSSYWQGNLAQGLDTAMRGVIEMQRYPHRSQIPGLYVQEILLYIWLEMDGPGYAGYVLDAVNALAAQAPGRDVKLRLELLRARCLSEQAQFRKAHNTLIAAAPYLGWQAPYYHALIGHAFFWVDHYKEALAAFREAEEGFVTLGLTIEANEARLAAGNTLLALQQYDSAMDALELCLTFARDLPNRAQVGASIGLIGRCFARMEQIGEAIGCYSAALDHYRNLGWLRTEAVLSMAILEEMNNRGIYYDDQVWQDAIRTVEEKLVWLRSGDLTDHLNAILHARKKHTPPYPPL